jgi:MT-A70
MLDGTEPATATFHPYAELFPLMEGAEFASLVADIKANGLREPIVEYGRPGGPILDGRNRYRACMEADVPMVTRVYEGNDPLTYVLSLNLHRRHLGESQRAMIASKLANMKQGARTDLQPSANLPEVVSQPDAARLLNVSDRLVRDAKVVREKGVPELVERVERGELPVSAAASVAKLDKKTQRKIAKEKPSVVRAAAKQAKRAAREKELAEDTRKASETLEQKAYAVLYADPPWRFEPYSRDTGLDRSADNHYPTMTIESLREMKVPAADDAVLFMWATVPMLPEALEVMAAWRFKYVSHFVWVNGRCRPPDGTRR